MRLRPFCACLFVLTLSACPQAPDGDGPAPDGSSARDAEADAEAPEEDGGPGGHASDAEPRDVPSIDGDGGARDGDDAGSDAEACAPIGDPVPTSTTPRTRLALTGLYVDTASKTLAPGVEYFEPAHVLWSDGATKRRYVRLPGCEKVDTEDMDDWSLPVGARLWKEFTVDGKRIETRLIERFGPGPTDFHFLTYAWDDQEQDAVLVLRGVPNARGTTHDIPATGACVACHRSAARVLGFSALQLSHAGPGATMASLSARGRLTRPARAGFEIPGDALAREALGYLHANCGNCHNDEATGIPFRTPFVLRLSTLDLELEATGAMRTAVGVPVERFIRAGITTRIARGQPGSSCVVHRMSVRGDLEQMPPLASEIVDSEGLTAVRAWVESL